MCPTDRVDTKYVLDKADQNTPTLKFMKIILYIYLYTQLFRLNKYVSFWFFCNTVLLSKALLRYLVRCYFRMHCLHWIILLLVVYILVIYS
jgi:hypothetical protein